MTVRPSRSRQDTVRPASPPHDKQLSDSPVCVCVCVHAHIGNRFYVFMWLWVSLSPCILNLLHTITVMHKLASLRLQWENRDAAIRVKLGNTIKIKKMKANIIKSVCSCCGVSSNIDSYKSFLGRQIQAGKDIGKFPLSVNSTMWVLKWFAAKILLPLPLSASSLVSSTVYGLCSSVSILICEMSLSIFNDHPNEAFTSCLPALHFPLLPLEHFV